MEELFGTFKTKRGTLTGEVQRRRKIIAVLATHNIPNTTRRKISQYITGNNAWKNLYSGIYHDLNVLIPMGLVQEAGRLPLKHGPKAMQEQGISYYKLTILGLVVALALQDVTDKYTILKKIQEQQKSKYDDQLLMLAKIMPQLVGKIFEVYVKEYFAKKIPKLLPLDFSILKDTDDETLKLCKEIIHGYKKITKTDQDEIDKILN